MESLAGLNGWLLVDAEHDTVLRRVDVEATYLQLSLLELRIPLPVREEPYAVLVGLEVEVLQNVVDPALPHPCPGRLRNPPDAPVRVWLLRTAAGGVDYLQDVLVVVPARSARPGKILQPFHSFRC